MERKGGANDYRLSREGPASEQQGTPGMSGREGKRRGYSFLNAGCREPTDKTLLCPAPATDTKPVSRHSQDNLIEKELAKDSSFREGRKTGEASVTSNIEHNTEAGQQWDGAFTVWRER